MERKLGKKVWKYCWMDVPANLEESDVVIGGTEKFLERPKKGGPEIRVLDQVPLPH